MSTNQVLTPQARRHSRSPKHLRWSEEGEFLFGEMGGPEDRAADDAAGRRGDEDARAVEESVLTLGGRPVSVRVRREPALESGLPEDPWLREFEQVELRLALAEQSRRDLFDVLEDQVEESDAAAETAAAESFPTVGVTREESEALLGSVPAQPPCSEAHPRRRLPIEVFDLRRPRTPSQRVNSPTLRHESRDLHDRSTDKNPLRGADDAREPRQFNWRRMARTACWSAALGCVLLLVESLLSG